MALMRGCHPADGSVLRSMTRASTVAAVDLTFSAPKSMSVLFAVAGGEVSGALVEAHERAVVAAVAYLEREACLTRRGRGGAQRVAGEGFVAAAYRHRLSRAGDPQLHSHVVVANLTRADGRFTALDAHTIYEHKSAAGAVYRAALRAEVRERLAWVAWQQVGRGLFEIDGVPEAVLRHFSQRRAEIVQRAVELVGADAVGSLSRERMQGIALATRRAKSNDSIDGERWRADARARSAEHGFGPGDLAQLRAQRPADPVRPSLHAVTARLSGADGLTATHNTFTRRHAVAELAGEFTNGIRPGALERAADQYLQHPSVGRLALSDEGVPRFTTEDLLACERAILDSAQRCRGRGTAVLSDHVVTGALARSQPALNADQAAAVRLIATSGNGVDTAQALAGTGKTTMMRAVADAYRTAGYTVIGAAPTARAARELRNVAGVSAGTLHALAAKLDRTRGLPPKTVLLLDEAGMASTRISANIFQHAEQAGVKVIAVGDPGQLASVGAGGWLAALTRQNAGPELRQVLRQNDPAERDALEALHDGDSETYLDHKAEQITIHATEHDALDAVIDQWADTRAQRDANAVAMIARDNMTRDQLNLAARERLKADLALSDPGVIIGGREWAAGERIIARRNNRQLNVDNGTVATITRFDRERNTVLITTDNGEERAISASYLVEHVEYAYAITGHSSQGATVENTIVVGRPEEFTREWAYTALSRARHDTSIHLIADHSPAEHERRDYAPPQPDREPADALNALVRAMRRSEAELLAVEHPALDPPSLTPGGRTHEPLAPPTPARLPGWASRESTRPAQLQDPASRPSLGR